MDSYTRRAARNVTLSVAVLVAYTGGLVWFSYNDSPWLWVLVTPMIAAGGLMLIAGVTSLIELTAKDYRDRDREELERTTAPHP